MKQLLLFITAMFLATTLIAEDSNQKSVSVTVYNSNLGVIKDFRELDISSGVSTIKLTDVAQRIDPTSVHIKLDGEVFEQNYQYDLVSLQKILHKYVDKNIQLIAENGNLVEGKLLSAFGGQLVIEKSDGGLLMLPNLNKYQISVGQLPDGLITKPTLVWKVNANKSGKQDVEVSYQTSGMNWHTEYVAVLNENDTKMDLNSWVSIDNNSGATYTDAKLKLIAGDVNRVNTPPKNYARKSNIMYEVASIDEGFVEKEFFEYHIYNLERPTTIANNETKQISLFEASNIDIEKKYIYKSNSHGYGSKDGKVAVFVKFKNDKASNLGVPMPKGKVRLYKSDGESIEFIGEDLIDHTPKNETLDLKVGDAFDIVAEEKQTDHKKISNRVYEQEYEITLKNRKSEDVVVEVERYLGYNWIMLNTNIDYKKESATQITFQVPIKADDEIVLKFRVRYSN